MERIQLRPKAFSILKYLTDNAGRLVTHDEIMERLWRNTYVQPEVLASHIRDIRVALGDDARRPRFVETVARRGYRFIARVGSAETVSAHQAKGAGSRQLVGRESPLSTLLKSYQAATTGRRQLVFVTGEPGIGKTALCREFLRQLRGDEQAPYMAWGQCIEGYGVQEPYFPVLKAVSQLCSAGGEPVMHVFKAKAPTCMVQFSDLLTVEQRLALESDTRGATSGRMLREMLDALEELGKSRPVVVVLDDLQWVDRATVDVISEFARRHEPARVLIVGAYRPLEAFLSENPIKALKDALVAHQLCGEIGLASLTQADVADYLAPMCADEALRIRLANLLYRRSEGNSLFMVAALEHIVEQGLMHDRDGRLCLTVPVEELGLDIPRTLRTVIEAQIDHLSAEGRRVLEAASVAGVDFTPAAVAAAADYPLAQVEDICHDLARRQQVIRPAGIGHHSHAADRPRYEFVHVLYREVLYEQQAPGRRSARHLLIGRQLERLYGGQVEDVASELALHFEHALDWEAAVRYLRISAENAERRYSHREAIALLQQALEGAVRLPEEKRREVELRLLEKLAMSYVASFDARCVETYERLAEAAASYGFAEKCADALLNMATCLSWDDSDRCLKVAERVSRVASNIGDPLMQARLQMSCHFWRVWAGGWNTAEAQQASRIFLMLRRQCETATLARESIDFGMLQWASSEYRESYQAVAEGLEAISDALVGQNPYLSIAYQKAQFYLPRALLFQGEWGRALQVLDASIELADKNGDSFPAHMLRLSRSWVHFHAMDFEEVLTARALVENLGDRFGGSYLVRLGRLLFGSADVALGNYESAAETLRMTREEMNSHPIVLDWCFRLPLQAALSELWLSSGRLSLAREEAGAYLRLAFSTDDRTYQALALEVSARVAMALGDTSVALDFIARGIRVIEQRTVPLAAWRVHATAASLLGGTGEAALAQRHHQKARVAILSLADSLAERHALKAKFLSSLIKAGVLQEGTGHAA